jgi:hypothetical protein
MPYELIEPNLRESSRMFEGRLRARVCPYCGTALVNNRCPKDNSRFGYALKRIAIADNRKNRKRRRR